MSKISRETIVLVSAIAGANLVGIVTHQNSANSLDCSQNYLPQAESSQVISQPRTDIPYWQNNPWGNQPKREGYYDVRLKKDVYFPVQHPDANHAALPLLAPASAAMAPSEAAAPASPMDRPVASDKIQTIYGLMTRAEYTTARRAMPSTLQGGY